MAQNRERYDSSEKFHPKSGILRQEQDKLAEIPEFQISPARLLRKLMVVIAVLVCLSTLGQIASRVYGYGRLLGFVRLFYVDEEANISSVYSSFAWMLCSVTAAIIAMNKKHMRDRFAKHWRGLMLVFAYLALDEGAAIHELAIEPMRTLFNASGLFYFAWIIPGGLLLLVFVASFFKFLRTLPAKTQVLLTIAGSVFVTGAIGMEMIGAWYTERWGIQADLTYAFIATSEETLEMLGVLILLYTLLSYLGSYAPSFRFKVVSDSSLKAARAQNRVQ